jgi:adenosylcobinamide kinase/adenosylcobinamide-phosphate guanylyltransferase
MEAKIAAHRARRLGQGWRTVEAPLDLEQALTEIEMGEIVLVDCVTYWLTNQMLDDADLGEECDVLCDVLEDMEQPAVLVTNDVSGGIVPENPLARAFRAAQGRLNQRLAAQADLVVQITAGLPLVLKGAPEFIEGWDIDDAADIDLDDGFDAPEAPHNPGAPLW